MFIAQNLKFIRKKKGLSQEEMASLLGLNRSTYSGYENEVAQPNLELLLQIAQGEKIPLESLISKELSKLSAQDLDQMQGAWKSEASGKHLRVLATVVNTDNEEAIELISEKVSAGYTSGYADPDYLQELPTLRLPFLSKERKYRAFPISGDSMPPVVHGSYVVGEFVQDWLQLPSNTPCVVVTKEDGIVFKYVQNLLQQKQSLRLSSTNPLYAPYEVPVADILEVWRFVSYISKELPDILLDHTALSSQLRSMQADLQSALGLQK